MTKLEQIKSIAADIDDEIMGAQHYGKIAKKLREYDPNMARSYATMASQELGHRDMLMDMMRKICRDAIEEDNKAGISAICELTEERTEPWVAKVRGKIEGM